MYLSVKNKIQLETIIIIDSLKGHMIKIMHWFIRHIFSVTSTAIVQFHSIFIHQSLVFVTKITRIRHMLILASNSITTLKTVLK